VPVLVAPALDVQQINTQLSSQNPREFEKPSFHHPQGIAALVLVAPAIVAHRGKQRENQANSAFVWLQGIAALVLVAPRIVALVLFVCLSRT